jgi:hypothetical protein
LTRRVLALGSGVLRCFDGALVGDLSGALFAIFGTVYVDAMSTEPLLVRPALAADSAGATTQIIATNVASGTCRSGVRFTPGALRGTGTSGCSRYLEDPRLCPDCAPSVPNQGGLGVLREFAVVRGIAPGEIAAEIGISRARGSEGGRGDCALPLDPVPAILESITG